MSWQWILVTEEARGVYREIKAMRIVGRRLFQRGLQQRNRAIGSLNEPICHADGLNYRNPGLGLAPGQRSLLATARQSSSSSAFPTHRSGLFSSVLKVSVDTLQQQVKKVDGHWLWSERLSV